MIIVNAALSQQLKLVLGLSVLQCIWEHVETPAVHPVAETDTNPQVVSYCGHCCCCCFCCGPQSSQPDCDSRRSPEGMSTPEISLDSCKLRGGRLRWWRRLLLFLYFIQSGPKYREWRRRPFLSALSRWRDSLVCWRNFWRVDEAT